MSVIPYTENPPWVDGIPGGTRIDAADLNALEQGITDAHLQPAVRAYHSASQSIADVTTVALALNSERVDQVGGVASTMHDNTTNNSRLTARYAGFYLIIGNVEWASNPTNGFAAIRLNGTTTIGRIGIIGDLRQMIVSTMWPLVVNDYVELIVRQESGAAINITSAGYSPEFMMVRVG